MAVVYLFSIKKQGEAYQITEKAWLKDVAALYSLINALS